MSGYGLELDDVEHARLRAQAAGVRLVDDDLWPLAGVVPGADVVDLGCGPAAVMLELLPLVGPDGTLTGVDADPGMVERGQAEVAAAGAGNVVVREGLAQDSGLPAGAFDTAVVRLVLIHNGGREQEIVDHAASLVRPGGRVLLYDLDSTMIRVVPPSAPVSELHERYQAYQRAGQRPGGRAAAARAAGVGGLGAGGFSRELPRPIAGARSAGAVLGRAPRDGAGRGRHVGRPRAVDPRVRVARRPAPAAVDDRVRLRRGRTPGPVGVVGVRLRIPAIRV
ncbi:MAG TPA: class I SAM-dependent methyltransferase [Pseudonocardiaceae bacterium]|nr:class I SAM-dependent methyltransferase [Pseudonocardiaceae bacterium]